jgi:hypothetical protein
MNFFVFTYFAENFALMVPATLTGLLGSLSARLYWHLFYFLGCSTSFSTSLADRGFGLDSSMVSWLG